MAMVSALPGARPLPYFETELDARLKNSRRESIWIIMASLIYHSMLFGRIEVLEEFECDFASVPRIPIVYSLWGNRAHREGVLHDWAFRKDAINPKTGKPFTFMEANRLFLEAMECRGKPFYIRYPMYSAVCAFSYGHFHKRLIGCKL